MYSGQRVQTGDNDYEAYFIWPDNTYNTTRWTDTYLLYFVALIAEGFQTDIGAQATHRTGNIVGEIAFEYPQDAVVVARRHVRSQPAATVGLSDQYEPVGVQGTTVATTVRIPSINVALAPVPEIHSGPTVRAQYDHLFRLETQFGNGALGASLPQVARVDWV